MQATIRCAFVAFLSFVLCLSASSQVLVGTYPYGTFDNKGFDSINVGNLNVHFGLPIISKPGRGLPFSYTLGYDSSVWYPYDAGGGPAWTPTQSFGWFGDTAVTTGYFWYNTDAEMNFFHGLACWEYTYSSFHYVDPLGHSHIFLGSTNDYSDCHGLSHSSFTRSALDRSGYTMTVTGYTNVVITDPHGAVVTPPAFATAGAGSVVDSNGNEITTGGSGTFVDTLGTNVLVIGGGAPSNETFTYKDSTGTNQSVTLAYQSYTVETNFGCSGIGEYGPMSQYLVHTATYPDGSQYTFDYEATPGASTHVTGRIGKVTLPTGGRISYTYSGEARESTVPTAAQPYLLARSTMIQRARLGLIQPQRLTGPALPTRKYWTETATTLPMTLFSILMAPRMRRFVTSIRRLEAEHQTSTRPPVITDLHSHVPRPRSADTYLRSILTTHWTASRKMAQLRFSIRQDSLQNKTITTTERVLADRC